jgi:GC-rich sequence DNA-binding factor
MFKKSNRKFNAKRADQNSDQSDNEDQYNLNSREQNDVPSQKTSPTKKSLNQDTKLLFAKPIDKNKQRVLCLDEEDDDDENSTEFKVKKSKESRRIARELKKSKKEREKGDTQQSKEDSSSTKMNAEEFLFNEGIKVKPLQIQLKKADYLSKYSQNRAENEADEDEDEFKNYKAEMIDSSPSSSSENETDHLPDKNIDNLRQEMAVISGQDHMDHLVEKETDDTKRSVKIMLKNGIIPDSAVIHAARKKREMMARQGGDDYISLTSSNRPNRSKKLSEDESDLSEVDEDESKALNMNYKENIHRERQKTRDEFLAYEEGSDADDDDVKKQVVTEGRRQDSEEEDDWEKEQINRGVLLLQVGINIFYYLRFD